MKLEVLNKLDYVTKVFFNPLLREEATASAEKQGEGPDV